MVWFNRTVLKGKCDPVYNWKFFVDLMKPEMHKANQARFKCAYDQIIEGNKHKEIKDKVKLEGDKLIKNDEVVPNPVSPPLARSLVAMSKIELNDLDDIMFVDEPGYTLSSSTFKAFSTPVASFEEAQLAYKKLRLDNLYASHIMMACAFHEGEGVSSFSCDDGEDSGGIELEKIMEQNNFIGYALFVVHWKLGGNLGPRRFKCIEAVATQVIKKTRMKEELRSRTTTSSTGACSNGNTTSAKQPSSPTPERSATKDSDGNATDEYEDDKVEK